MSIQKDNHLNGQPDHSHPHPHDHEHHEDGHDHDHDHPHPHNHEDGHHHDHGKGIWGWISTIFHLHGHSYKHDALVSDKVFLDNQEGIRTVWLALVALTITSLLQIVIVAWSGSVALLADTIHNIGDGLNDPPPKKWA